MDEWERMKEAIAAVGNACQEFASAFADYVCKAVNTFMETLDLESIASIAAYAAAAKEHPEWVHKANYSKKKRIRKKYHDRIMRQWRCSNGKS